MDQELLDPFPLDDSSHADRLFELGFAGIAEDFSQHAEDISDWRRDYPRTVNTDHINPYRAASLSSHVPYLETVNGYHTVPTETGTPDFSSIHYSYQSHIVPYPSATFIPHTQPAYPYDLNLHLDPSQTPRNPPRIAPLSGAGEGTEDTSFTSSLGLQDVIDTMPQETDTSSFHTDELGTGFPWQPANVAQQQQPGYGDLQSWQPQAPHPINGQTMVERSATDHCLYGQAASDLMYQHAPFDSYGGTPVHCYQNTPYQRPTGSNRSPSTPFVKSELPTGQNIDLGLTSTPMTYSTSLPNYGAAQHYGPGTISPSVLMRPLPTPGMGGIPTGPNNDVFPPPSGTASTPIASTSHFPVPLPSPIPPWAQPPTYHTDGTVWSNIPGPSLQPPLMPSFDSSGSLSHSTISTPSTSGRQRHPTIGNRLAPGPKAGRKSKKLQTANGSSPYIPSPNGMKEESDTSGTSSHFTSPENGSLPQERKPSTSGKRSATPLLCPLLVPPPLVPVTAPSALMGPGPSAFSGPSGSASQLHLPPANRAHEPEGSHVVGLSKEFIHSMYDEYTKTDEGQSEKRFKCLIKGCEREFPRKSAVTSHIQTHLDDRPYVCDDKGCNSRFVRLHDLRRHSRIHTDQKPFPCGCGSTFTRGDALMRHRERAMDPGCDEVQRTIRPTRMLKRSA